MLWTQQNLVLSVEQVSAVEQVKTKRSYKSRGGKIGRPSTRTKEQILQNSRRLEKEYQQRRGKFIVKINYYTNKFQIPQDILNLPQSTDEEILFKFNQIYDEVRNNKKKQAIATIKPKQSVLNALLKQATISA